MGELYGEVNKLTMEWKDGLMAISVRRCVQVSVILRRVDHYMILHGGHYEKVRMANAACDWLGSP